MELKVFSIRDAKGECYHPPFYKKTIGEAERDFRSLVNDKDSNVFKYPEDYDLYYMGTFDDSTGKLESLDSPQHMEKAVHLKQSVN